MTKKSTVDPSEIVKFAQHASGWWEPEGPLKTLHDINPTRIQFIKKYVQLQGCSVLDVGCGGGILSEGMAAEGAIVVGLDVEKEAIAVAQEHALGRSLDVTYVCQPIESYRADPFDLVTCLEMLEHVTDPVFVIEQCARLLKSEGYLIVSTLNRTLKAYVTAIIGAEYFLNLIPRQTHAYEKFIKPSELAAMVRAAGLEVVGITGMAYHPLLRRASLESSVSVNYLLVCQKRES